MRRVAALTEVIRDVTLLRMRALVPSACVLAVVCGCGPAPLSPRDPTPGVVHFEVQTYNMNNDQSGDQAIIDAAGYANADILCLQEVTAEYEQGLRKEYSDRYPHMLFQPMPDAGGLAVLSRFPLTDKGYHIESHGWHPAWHVEVETPMGPVQLLNVHLRSLFTGESSRVTSYLTTNRDHLQELEAFTASCAKSLPTIVAGDFNEEPDGVGVKYLEDRGFQNALPLFHPGQWTWRQPPAWQMEQTIDHILFDSAFDPLNSWVEQRGDSDHLPVVAHFEAAPL
jgi:endonuclease/exonuclease/phosphatase family metal-dependent hydrolase